LYWDRREGGPQGRGTAGKRKKEIGLGFADSPRLPDVALRAATALSGKRRELRVPNSNGVKNRSLHRKEPELRGQFPLNYPAFSPGVFPAEYGATGLSDSLRPAKAPAFCRGFLIE
jgi:hypothetical protein